MARYIDADAVIQVLDRSRNHLCALSCSKDIVDKQIADVKDIPTADVRPNVKGEWKEGKYGIKYCSDCGAINNSAHKNFCPNCGVDMRGETNAK